MGRKGKEKEDLKCIKAAARAWYEHGGGSGKVVKEGIHINTRRAAIRRPSRYKMEAMKQINISNGSHEDLNETTFSIDIGIDSGKSRKSASAAKSSLEWDNALNIPKRVSFKVDNVQDVMFCETKNIINLACENNFSSSLFDTYEIKTLSKYVLSICDSDDDTAGSTKRNWKGVDFSYDVCLPRASFRSKRRFHFCFPKYGHALCSSKQFIFSTKSMHYE
ncbi:hypothetical protein SUGI_0810570 [Cryptomeria japonica]|nr:hypothetical protein SUGI_0810570 [Cryptomeria japonica]